MCRRPGAHSLKAQTAGARYRAWQAMRVLKRFTSADLVATAGVKLSNIQKLIRGLAAIGYLRPVGRTPGQSGFVIYQLVRNTGPLPPRLRNDGSVYDANDGLIYTAGTLTFPADPTGQRYRVPVPRPAASLPLPSRERSARAKVRSR